MTEARAGWPQHHSGRPAVWSDPSFTDWLRRHPELEAIERYLPAASTPAFAGEDRLAALQSSYAERGYGRLFYALVRTLTPRQCVEIGIFQGFSLLAAAAGLRDNGAGNIAGYDLFDDYPYRHAEQPLVAAQIAASGLAAWTTLHHADVAQVHDQWEAVDYLHVDVSNHGDTYRRVFSQWAHKVRRVIVLEGGSRERDNVDWMLEYGKPAIGPALDELRRAYPEWSISVLEPFPSLTVALRRPPMPDHAP